MCVCVFLFPLRWGKCLLEVDQRHQELHVLEVPVGRVVLAGPGLNEGGDPASVLLVLGRLDVDGENPRCEAVGRFVVWPKMCVDGSSKRCLGGLSHIMS